MMTLYTKCENKSLLSQLVFGESSQPIVHQPQRMAEQVVGAKRRARWSQAETDGFIETVDNIIFEGGGSLTAHRYTPLLPTTDLYLGSG